MFGMSVWLAGKIVHVDLYFSEVDRDLAEIEFAASGFEVLTWEQA